MNIQQVPTQVYEQTTISSQVKFMNKLLVPSQVYEHTTSSKSSSWTYNKFLVKFMNIQQVPRQVHVRNKVYEQSLVIL